VFNCFFLDLRDRACVCVGFCQMSKPGALDLASGLGGKIEKSEVLSAVEQYDASLTLLSLQSCDCGASN
jgi:hypothetical protein